jgi:2-C-methyl-D-erythritol 4-phosphate cytidylyltransferase
VVEVSGESITLCEGDYSNIKITTPNDMVLAEAILKAMEEQEDGEDL